MIAIDIGELWDGATDERQGRRGRWTGGFKGRPLLADQIFPALQIITQSEKPKVIKSRLSCVRNFFRFMDAYETWCKQEGSSAFTTEIKMLEDITVHHLQMWKTPSPAGEWQQAEWAIYQSATQCLREAANRLGLQHLIVPSYTRDDTDRRDIPDERIGIILVKALAKEANKIWAHWDRSDALAARGRNFVGIERVPTTGGHTTIIVEGGVTEADLHATYRAAVTANKDLPMDRVIFLTFWGYYGVSTPSWWPRYGIGHPNAGKKIEFYDLQTGLYPTVEQSVILFILFLARTGWNPSTALSLDISKEVSWSKEYTKKFVWLFAYKPRSRQWQDTVSFKNQRTGPYQIIKRLMSRTEKLRQAIEANPSLCTNFKIGKRSPWLYQRTCQHDEKPIRVEFDNNIQGVTLRRVIATHNAQQAASDQFIPTNLAPSDLRDIFAGATFTNSGFSLYLTQLALGHKKSATTFNYLRRRAWRAESEKKKNEMVVALIDQIETHRVIDLTLLRAKMDGITVTDEQIARLEAYRSYRTYVGAGCSDPTHPPAYIDPTNPCDGSTPCAQGHLCAGCSKGRVFNDSLPDLARRCAELEWLRETLPLEVFQDSSLADQLLVMRATLKQWPTSEVEHHVIHWLAMISSGEHRPIRFSGEH